jgi:hypothetical protein
MPQCCGHFAALVCLIPSPAFAGDWFPWQFLRMADDCGELL